MLRPRAPCFRCLATSLCGLVLSATASAALYRWVDENGVTVYAQSPPPNGGGERVEPRFYRAPARAPITERVSPEDQVAKREAEKKAATEKAEQAKAEAARKKNCEAARQNLDTLRNLGARRVRYPDGTYERLSEDEVLERIRRTQEQIDELCKPGAAAAPSTSPHR